MGLRKEKAFDHHGRQGAFVGDMHTLTDGRLPLLQVVSVAVTSMSYVKKNSESGAFNNVSHARSATENVEHRSPFRCHRTVDTVVVDMLRVNGGCLKRGRTQSWRALMPLGRQRRIGVTFSGSIPGCEGIYACSSGSYKE